MGTRDVLFFEEKDVVASEINASHIVDKEILRGFFFEDEFALLQNLPQFGGMEKETIHVFYPGSGSDVLFPLGFLEKLCSGISEIMLTMVDLYDSIGMIKTILHELNVGFTDVASKNGSSMLFYWNGMKVGLKFIEANVFSFLQEIDKFDVYFERRFRIMRDGVENYETHVWKKLREGGLLIVDHGFLEIRELLEKIDVDDRLSSYGEMVVGIKKKEA